MTEEHTKRKLTAILSADVKGYSRLMEDDEEATVRTINAYREVMVAQIRGQNGRVVDAKGDNVLAEFASVVDAVRCAVEIQKELGKRNDQLPENRRMEFRIGINLRDVIEEKETIYGDGVNIAARLEALADGGGVCISGTAFDHIGKKLPIGYEYLGEQTVKNIEKPVRAYKVLMEPEYAGKVMGEERPKPRHWRWAAVGGVVVLAVVVAGLAIWTSYFRPAFEPASEERMAFPLPEKPSIAVLPFDNMSGDPEQDYIADGFTENIITGLSQIPEMFVIARNSVFTYKGKPVKVKQVSEELGVKYVLEGSVQKAGDRLRVTGQLIDALEGRHLWAERYDREHKELFDLQDEITMKILKALQMKLTWGERASSYRTDSFEAWAHFVRGYSRFDRFTKEDNLKAREHFEQATRLDPDYADAWTMLAWTHLNEVRASWSESPAESIKQSFELAQKSSAIEDSQASLHTLMNMAYMMQGQYDKAIAEGQKSISLDPNNSRSHIVLAQTLQYAGRPEEAIVHAKKAMRLEPYYPAFFLAYLAGSLEMVGRYEEALQAWEELLKRALEGEFPPIWVHERLAINYARLDQMEKARAHATDMLAIKPDYTVDFFRKTTPYKDRAYLDSLVDLLIKAGLPEHPPLALPDKPSIAVLPFENMSGDPEQEYFSDGITEEIITALSKTPKLFVIARNSTFTYKGKPVKVQQVGRDLGVKYVLEGSVRKAEDKMRITAQLVDAQTGHHLWAERYDRDLKDIFALQDEITMKIINALQVELTEGEQARLLAKGTENLQAYLKYLEGFEQLLRFNKEANVRAKQLLEEAITLDPEFGLAYSALGRCHWLDANHGWSGSPSKSVQKAFKLTQQALSLDDSLYDPHILLGAIYISRGQREKAIDEAERAVELCPNAALAICNLGWILRCVGRPEEGIPLMKKAIRLDPTPPVFMYDILGRAYFLTGRYEEAIAEYNKGVRIDPDYLDVHIGLASTYSVLGREEEARAEVAEIFRIDPNFSINWYANMMQFQVGIEPEIEGLRKAGLK